MSSLLLANLSCHELQDAEPLYFSPFFMHVKKRPEVVKQRALRIRMAFLAVMSLAVEKVLVTLP